MTKYELVLTSSQILEAVALYIQEHELVPPGNYETSVLYLPKEKAMSVGMVLRGKR